MGLDRRTFLQRAALALVSVGASEAGIDSLSRNPRFSRWLKPYVETLAQTTNRKLALLVGINEYSERNHLAGCLNDVELQKELLVNCFGFNPQDVLILTNRQATEEKIRSAFTEHLAQQAQRDDVVLFHFSGYGSQVKQLGTEPKANSLLAVNTKDRGLLEKDLYNQTKSLETPNVITVLDTSFQPTQETLQGNYRIRSTTELVATQESGTQSVKEQSLNPLKGLALGVKSSNAAPGILLTAAEEEHVALEGTWNGFSAGLLTYALSRYLWKTNPRTTVQVAFQDVVNRVNSWSEKQQKPRLQGKLKSNLSKVANNSAITAGEGFIAAEDSKGMLDLHLTALNPVLLDSYHEESCFTVGKETKQSLQLRSLEGIKAKAQLVNNLLDSETIVGSSIQEAIRVMPRNLGLNVALDNHLERIERVDATSAFAQMSEVKTVASAGEAYADCVVGKISVMVDKTPDAEPHAKENPVYSYGIYTSRGKLIASTPGETGEVIKLAVKRLQPYFARLLAAKWLELTVNNNSSRIPVTASIESASRNSALIEQQTLSIAKAEKLNAKIPTIQGNSPLKMRISNQSDRDLYGVMVGLDNEEKFSTLYIPQATVNTPGNFVVSAQAQATIPKATSQWQWKAIKPSGITKMYLILATQPFTQTLDLLGQQPAAKLDTPQLINIADPLALTRAILEDLNSSSNVDESLLTASSDLYAWDVNNWASFSFVYDVI